MTGGNPGLRLRLSRIEKLPKPVYAEQFQDFANIRHRPELVAELDDMIESIERGDGVPERLYRAGIDRDADGLLASTGIMHLHLGGKNSDTIVFLIQYADRVVLLETNTHVHFRTQPAGKNILALSQSWLRNLESALAEAATKRDGARSEAERAALAASIAAFKAKAGLLP